MGMKANLVMLGHIHGTVICLGRGVEHVLQPHPHMDSAVRAAMPLLDECFIRIERFEIIMVWVLSNIRDKHRADTELRGRLGTAMHVTPHIHDGSCSR